MPSGVRKSPSALSRAAGLWAALKQLVTAWCNFFCLFLAQELAPSKGFLIASGYRSPLGRSLCCKGE